MRLINVAEIVLFSMLDGAIKQYNTCGCERCKLDIAAITLNSLPPSYVVSTEGEVMKSISPQLKVDVRKQLDLAMQIVKHYPHHERV